MMELFSPKRIYLTFRFLCTLFLVIKKKESFLGLKPLPPQKLKDTIITLGASFIKLAQVLATRSDFFSSEYLEQLKMLHDDIPPMKRGDFEAVFQRAFQTSPFESFDSNPIASASIGQVHIGYLKGEKVAVKLRRVGIKERVQADIKIISFFNTLFRPLFSKHTKNSIEAVIREFSKMILQEVSLKHEVENLIEFSEVYKDFGILFPKPYLELCTDEVIVMSFMDGFRFDDKENLLHYGIDFKEIIAKLVNFYTTQMLIRGYFHADPHPGNLLVTTKGELVLLDFGMVKSVPNDTRLAIIELIKSANEQDYEAYIIANKKLGTISYEAPVNELATFTKKMFKIFSNDNLSSESMQKLAFEVLESTKDLPFKLPSDAIYILRVSAIIEGLGTTYIENFNGIKDILPILQKNIPNALGLKNSLLENIQDELKGFPTVVKNLKSTLQKVANNQLIVELNPEQIGYLEEKISQKIKSYMVSLSFLFGGIFVYLLDKEYKEIAIALFVFGVARIFYK
ncbi:MAG: AarF/UbiB family protein [Arcobacteraceae bacterium]|nr:AarF/UbiB family protein [Arcobacteraceae bacterium]